MELKPEDRALVQEIDREHAEELKQEERIVEALLFAMGRAVSLPEMAAALDADEMLAKAAAERLLKEYEARQGGMLIRRVETAYQLCTNPLCYDALIRVVSHPKKPVLSDVVLETLAIIAYKQPVTKAEIERIRGVQSDHAVNRLVEYGLVEESGRLNAPGRPALFVTTEEFLRRFGMESLKELPTLSEDMAAEIEAQVAEEVSDVLGTDPTTLQEELRNQRPETVASAEAEEDNAVGPMVPAVPVKSAVPRKRETAPVRAAVEAEQQEEKKEAKAVEPDEKETAAAVHPEDDEALEQMIYEAAVGTEPAAEQHYSFLEEEDALPEAETEETSEADAEAEAEDTAPESAFMPAADDAEDADAETSDAAEITDAAEATDAEDAQPETEETQEATSEAETVLPEASAARSGSRHHSIFDSVQVLSDAELEEIEEEERRFQESLTGLPPRKRKPDISENTEAAEPENTESKNTEAANAGGPES